MAFWIVVAVVVGVPAYALACWIWPFTYCRRCGGSGKRRSPSGRNYRRCRRCKGGGERLRVGRKVFNFLAGNAKAAR